ncbi:MAG: ABC transporter ATP-binding protein [Bacteroidales bacterium]|nr:ABC transporter ATP-binding protein [Bacteroidales bacterium]
MIRIQNLCKEFIVGDEVVRALKGVSFDIFEGEFVTIMGTSGSGKSTMLNILGCLDKPTKGSYELDSVETASLSKDDLAKIRNNKIGFVFQSYNLLPRTTCIENAELPLFYHQGISSAERQQRAIEALNLVGLQQRLLHTPNQLSGGQQQRVAIARALVNDPVVIFADEATGNLDTRMSYEIMGLFQDLNKQGKTIVFVTHEPDIAKMSKRTITLRDGLVISDEIHEHQVDAKEELAKLPLTD